MQRARFGAFLLGVLLVGPAPAPPREDSDRGKIVKVQLKTGPSFVGELLSETDDEVRWRDMKSGQEASAKKADLITFDKDLKPGEIQSRIGFDTYTTWKIKRKLGLTNHSGKIIEWTPPTAKVNLGRGHGLNADEALRVFRLKGDVVDPDTGELLGQDRELVARLDVIEVQKAYCVARVARGIGGQPRVGDLVRVEHPGKKVAVLPPVAEDGEETDQCRRLAARWTSMLKQHGVPVVERAAIDKVRSEARLNGDPRGLGSRLGVDAVLTGTVTGRGSTAELRLIDVRSGKVLLAATQRLRVAVNPKRSR